MLTQFVGPWNSLSGHQRDRLQQWVVTFTSRKNWEGCGGLRLSDDMKLAVAGQVGLMVLGWDQPFYFDHVPSILIYPNAFIAPRKVSIGSGMHLEAEQALEGEAWYGGPVIVSWSDVLEPARGKPHNLVIHEFAHQLDMLNGESADGIPPLPDRRRIDRWQAVLEDARDQLSEACRNSRRTILDCYGCSSQSELFAVSCEAFFEAGSQLFDEYPLLYQELASLFRLETHLWHSPWGVHS